MNKYIFLNFLAICFLATGGIFVKLSSLPAVSTGFYRILFSMPILYFFAKNELKNIKKQDFFIMFFAGVFLAFDLIAWHISFSYTSVANANLLGNLVPFSIILFMYFVKGERFKKSFYFACLITIIGLILLMFKKISLNSNLYGDFLAFITSIFYAFFLLSVASVAKKYKALSIIFVSGFGSLFVLFIAMIIKDGVQIPKDFYSFSILLAVAFISQIGGQGLLSYVISKINVTFSSLIVLTQPIIAAIYAFFLFHESLSVNEILGMLIILYGIFVAKKSLK